MVVRKVVRYGGRAGEALNVDEPPGDPYSQYEALLAGERDPTNKYHPFKSEMDWKHNPKSDLGNAGIKL